MRFLTLLSSLLLCGTLAAQVPQAFDFQAVARDASGNVLSGQAVSVRLTVHSASPGGAIAYQETHAVTTNAFGLFSVAVGQGSTVQGVFAEVDWSAAAHYLQVELDATGGSNYVDMGTTQLLSVPYALHAGGVDCPTVSLLGDTLKQANGCFVIIPGLSAANGGCADADNDGFYNNAGCPPLDCDDTDPNVNPGGTEVCGNGKDDDCDGVADNLTNPADFVLWYADVDGDGFGDDAATVSACAQPTGTVSIGGDCDDTDPAIFPGQNCSTTCTAAEVAWLNANFLLYTDALGGALGSCFGNGNQADCIQNALESQGIPLSVDCNACGLAWLACLQQECLVQCISSPQSCNACMLSSGCTASMIQCFGLVDADGDGMPTGSDCDDTDATVYNGAPELCDTKDNDCDGQVDEGNACCLDNDGDGFTNCDGDCDDNNLEINPGAAEICEDGVDNNCDGTVDNATTWFEDQDEDGFGNPSSSVDACEQPPGFVANGNDCDDQDPTIFPLAGPGIGCSSCSPEDRQWMDDNYLSLWNTTGVAVGECQGLTGQAAWDCLRNQIQPFVPIGPTCLQCAVERAFTVLGSCSTDCFPWLLSDGVVAGSVDCNLCTISNGVHTAFAACTGVVDLDGDGVPASADCNDNDATFRPGVEEICDGLDNNCDGQVDEGGVCGCAPAGTPCEDGNACTVNDTEDGACNCIGIAVSCDDGNPCTIDLCDPQTGCVHLPAPAGTACDDGNPNTINDVCDGTGSCSGTPIQNEVCNGIDDDGDGLLDAADPGLVLVLCENQVGVCSGAQKTSNLCVGGAWLTCSLADYDAGSPVFEPTETSCDTQDNDCDGLVDEDNVCDPCPGMCFISGACFNNGQENPMAPCQVCDTFQSTTSWSFRPFGTVCLQGTDCTFDSFCNGAGQCGSLNFKPAGSPCDDGNPNTINDVCNGAGSCTGTPCPDADADGFTTCQGDCNDSNANIRPGAVEVCDGVDNNCDSQVDEGGVCPPGATSEIEPNGTRAQADINSVQIVGPQSIVGSITPVADLDFFRVSNPAEQVWRFETFDNSGTDCTGGITSTLRFHNSAGALLVSDVASGISGCSAITYTVPAGTNYIQAEEAGNNGTIAVYRMHASVIPAAGTEVERNDIQAQANVLSGLELFAHGSHQLTSDLDWYAITVPAGGSVRAELIEGSTAESCESNGIDSRVTLFTSAGVQLVMDDDDGRGFCSLIDGTGSVPLDATAHNLASGTYYLQVRSSVTGAASQFDYRLVVTIR